MYQTSALEQQHLIYELHTTHIRKSGTNSFCHDSSQKHSES